MAQQLPEPPPPLETSRFLDAALAARIQAEYGTPTYVYSEKILREQGQKALAFPAAYGLTVRFAMKAW
jgi:diaminopimelate decarboxylase